MSPPVVQAPRTRSGWLVAGLWILGLAVAAIVFKGSPEQTSEPTALVSPSDVVSLPEVGGVTKPPNTMFVWSEETQQGPTVFTSEGLVLTLSGRADGDGRIPVLQVRGPDGTLATMEGESSLGAARAEIGVGKLDPKSSTSQVVFTSFGACAHRCGSVKVLDHLAGVWKVVEVATIEGAELGAFPADLDGDGKREFQLDDRRFNYQFASYAGSFTPPIIKALDGGELRDVSREPRFKALYERYMTTAQKGCEDHNNGACPAFVAAAARAGKTEWAWQIMLDAYDRADEWVLPSACTIAETDASCPDNRQLKLHQYPEALRWFLGATGYLPPVYIPATDETIPSFDCTKVQAETLKLVCATPVLVAADRELAWIYWRALANAKDPASIVESERAFIKTRNNAPSDAFTLLRLYQAQLEALRGFVGEP